MAYTPNTHDSDPSVKTPNFSKMSQTNFTIADDEDDRYFALPTPSNVSEVGLGQRSDSDCIDTVNIEAKENTDQNNANERPLSQLILAIQGTDAELMKQVAPAVNKHLKRFVKIPMVAQLSLAGIQAGVSMSSLKWFGEVVTQGTYGPQEYWIISVTAFIAVCSAILQLKFLNSAIASYQQIDFSAVYQVTVMIFTVICALILLDEASAYSWSGLAAVMAFTGLCVLGIYTVTLKTSSTAPAPSDELSDNFT